LRAPAVSRRPAYNTDQPLISVVVPTFNRAELLRRTLSALLRQSLDPAAYEILVVDNASTDATAEVVRRAVEGDTVVRTAAEGEAAVRGAAEGDSRVRYLFEPRQGVSHAKNAGLAAARGSFVAYTDDDGIPARDWLKAVVDAFQTVEPAPDVVGGPVLPVLMGRRPPWYRDSYETIFWGSAPRWLERHECFYGMNVSFRRGLLAEVGGFNPELGMRGPFLSFHEEPEVFERLWRHTGGLRAYYAPGAWVRHLIPESRVDPIYRLKRGFATGNTRRALESVSGNGAKAGDTALECCRLMWHLAWAGVALPRASHLAAWAITWGVPVARSAGYVAAALGVQPKVRRAH
jgi:glycosyltransferase involved in cell wall biosynthesis